MMFSYVSGRMQMPIFEQEIAADEVCLAVIDCKGGKPHVRFSLAKPNLRPDLPKQLPCIVVVEVGPCPDALDVLEMRMDGEYRASYFLTGLHAHISLLRNIRGPLPSIHAMDDPDEWNALTPVEEAMVVDVWVQPMPPLEDVSGGKFVMP